MVTLVASLTDQRSVEDCPRSMESGSAVNCAITGALDSEGAVGAGAVDVGGAGGGVIGAFFLHPAASITKHRPVKIVALLLILNSVLQFKNFYLAQIGISFLPWLVSCLTPVPSASMVKICILPLRLDAKTRCRPSGAQFGFSFRPAPCVN